MSSTTPTSRFLTDRSTAAARAALTGQRRGVRALLPFIGPGVVASIAYVDPGNFATNIQAGAGYGYELLWVVLLANLVAMLFQGLSARLGIVTGRNLAELSRDHFPRPVAVAMWAASEVARDGHRPGRVPRRRHRPVPARRPAPAPRHGRHRARHRHPPGARPLRLPPARDRHRLPRRGHRPVLLAGVGHRPAELVRRAPQHRRPPPQRRRGRHPRRRHRGCHRHAPRHLPALGPYPEPHPPSAPMPSAAPSCAFPRPRSSAPSPLPAS